MSTRVTKAQLQDEVEKLRALVDHLETTNAALQDQVAAQRNEGLGHNDELIDQLRIDVQQLQAENNALRAGQQQRVTHKVFEFNPAVPGDFARAMNEARKHNGVVRRMTQ